MFLFQVSGIQADRDVTQFFKFLMLAQRCWHHYSVISAIVFNAITRFAVYFMTNWCYVIFSWHIPVVVNIRFQRQFHQNLSISTLNPVLFDELFKQSMIFGSLTSMFCLRSHLYGDCNTGEVNILRFVCDIHNWWKSLWIPLWWVTICD